MRAVPIAELKAKLSAYLHEVRAGGKFTVLDRKTPVARIVPLEADDDFEVRPALRGATPLRRYRFPPPWKTRTDIVRLLLQDRNEGR